MNKLTAIFLISVSQAGFAASVCPILAGSYDCSGTSVEITQEQQGDTTVYTSSTGKKMIADGVARKIGDNSDFSGTETVYCGNKTLIRILANDLISSIETYAADEKSMTIYHDLLAPGQPLPAKPGQNGSETCSRK